MAEKLNLAKDSTMVACANTLAQAIRKYAPYPKIRASVRVGKSSGTTSGSRTIQVWVGNKNVPYARAFDTGSGLHDQSAAEPNTYRIEPVKKKYLAFHWEKFEGGNASDFFSDEMIERLKKSLLPDGRVKMNFVNHPGVEGTNYMQKAKDSVRKEIRNLIAKDGVENLKLHLKASFTSSITKR